MALITAVLEVSTSSNPLNPAPSWQQIPWTSIRTSRGRDDELDDVAAGDASITISDPARNLDTANPGSLYGTHIRPGRRIRIRSTAPASKPIYDGFLDDVETSYGIDGRDIAVTLPAFDVFALLAGTSMAPLADGVGQRDLPGVRIGRVLDLAGIPAAMRSIDVGRTRLPAHVADVGSALDYLHKVNRTEAGRFAVSADGKVTFVGRYPPDPGISLVLSDQPGQLPPGPMRTRSGIDRIITVAEVTWTGGALSTIEQDAYDLYGPRSKSFDTFIDYDQRARTFSQYVLMLRSEPQLRVPELSITVTSTAMATALLDLDLGDKVQLVRTPTAGPPITINATVERIRWSLSDMTTVCSLGFAPVPELNAWTWADAWDNPLKVWGY